jgi:hypothetical protein
MSITPLQMGIMLAAYTGFSNYNCNDKSTEVYREQHLALETLGLIIYSDPNDNFIVTEKGKFWLDAALRMPFPVQKWEIPK